MPQTDAQIEAMVKPKNPEIYGAGIVNMMVELQESGDPRFAVANVIYKSETKMFPDESIRDALTRAYQAILDWTDQPRNRDLYGMILEFDPDA